MGEVSQRKSLQRGDDTRKEHTFTEHLVFKGTVSGSLRTLSYLTLVLSRETGGTFILC